MKDLLLYVADADAQGFMKSILEKPRALGIRCHERIFPAKAAQVPGQGVLG